MRRLTNLGLIGVLLIGTLLLTPPVRASTSNQGNTTHVVAWGETLSDIAQHYGASVNGICAANGIVNPALIHAGQQLAIPTGGSSASAPPAGGGAHVVGTGENLYRIALRYGVTVQALAQLNGIANHNHVVVGQTLRIPGNSTPLAAPAPSQATAVAATHTVQAGETLAAIAMRHGVTTWTLIRANSIANPALIFAGQVLNVPGSSRPAASSGPAANPGGAKRIVVDISEQHLYAYQGGTLVYSFVASTGMPGVGTSTGTFSVLNKLPNAYASTWNLQMPYWMGIYWSGGLQNGIHALPILSNGQLLWAGYLGTPISYGCIVLGTYEASLLYEWADVGATVVIQY